LGAHLSVAGLSVSGVLAAWCAERRADVDLAVLLAPSFAPFRLPPRLVPKLSRLAVRLPNLDVWWHPFERERVGPPCSYPRFSTHALAESFLIGAELGFRRPRAREIIVVTNPSDPAVNNAATARVVAGWRACGATGVRSVSVDQQIGALHDFIGPYQPGARVDLVYPLLLRLIDGAG
jgi:hypothetical protein